MYFQIYYLYKNNTSKRTLRNNLRGKKDQSVIYHIPSKKTSLVELAFLGILGIKKDKETTQPSENKKQQEQIRNIELYSFECQLASIPKLPDASAYFSQQYNLYNFIIVKADLNSQNVTSFQWTDVDLPKN